MSLYYIEQYPIYALFTTSNWMKYYLKYYISTTCVTKRAMRAEAQRPPEH